MHNVVLFSSGHVHMFQQNDDLENYTLGVCCAQHASGYRKHPHLCYSAKAQKRKSTQPPRKQCAGVSNLCGGGGENYIFLQPCPLNRESSPRGVYSVCPNWEPISWLLTQTELAATDLRHETVLESGRVRYSAPVYILPLTSMMKRNIPVPDSLFRVSRVSSVSCFLSFSLLLL